ncbi:IPT/TIG domain-containing protein [Methanoregula sp.]|uniref:IPT/TIG domain-containing protein n=1 Tax=Methanoregula sp. TaxID=2052170 RepID=UPI003563FAAA
MDKSSGIISVFFLLLFAGVLIAGCSSDTPSSNATAAQPGVTTAASSGALYSAGDIIKNPKSSSGTALLIIKYDAGADTYERAYIYPNSDGTWGYRMDSKTEKISRSIIEKVYTQKVGTKSVSAIPISTPTAAVTATQVYTTKATTAASATTATTTTTSTAGLPKVISIEPDNGKTGTSVSITELKGVNFVTGATVVLVKSGGTNITATSVSVSSANLMTCTFSLPSDASVGYWDVLVTNPNGQYHQFKNGFNVRQGSTSSTTTTTTTTTSASTTAPTISSISPTSVIGSDRHSITISGSNFRSGIMGKLTQSSTTITSVSDCLIESGLTQMVCKFDIPTGTYGSWSLVVTNSDGSSVTAPTTLTVNT